MKTAHLILFALILTLHVGCDDAKPGSEAGTDADSDADTDADADTDTDTDADTDADTDTDTDADTDTDTDADTDTDTDADADADADTDTDTDADADTDETPDFGTTTFYYVATDGDDANPGTEDQPWRTIQKAAETLVAGEGVYVKAGQYSGDVEPSNSGGDGAWIVYSAYPGQERQAVLDGAAIRVYGKNYIRISGFTVQNSPNSGGIDVKGPGRGIYIDNNYTYKTYVSGISVWGIQYHQDPGDYENYHDVYVIGNKVEEGNTSGFNEGITLANGIVNFRVTDNEVCYGTIGGKDGIDVKEGAKYGIIARNHIHHLGRMSSVYIDAGGVLGFDPPQMHDIDIYDNIAHDNTGGGGFFHVGTEGNGESYDINIYNNIAYNGEQDGMMFYKHPASTGDIWNINVYNNTLYGNGRNGILLNDSTAVMNFWNNICYGNATDFRMQSGTYTESNNLVGIDPLFVNPGSGNFHIQAGSPAIDAGTSVNAPTVDLDGNTRDENADIGAYEFVE